MRVLWSMVVLVVLSLPGLARADGPPGTVESSTAGPPSETSVRPRPVVDTRREDRPFSVLSAAIGVNNPVGWYRGGFGVSLYAGLSRRFALRGNFAYYGHEDMLVVLANASAGGDIPSYRGRVIDYGIGLVWYPKRRWEGFMLEVGALLRDRETRTAHEDRVVRNWTTMYAWRNMIGWSWRIERVFIAAAVGISAGREVGREAVTPTDSSNMPATHREVSRQQVDGEAYLRIGLVLGD